MKRQIISIAVLSLAFSTAVFSTDLANISVKSKAGVNVSQYKTYKWLESTEIIKYLHVSNVNDPDKKWLSNKFDVNKELMRLFNNQLQAHGLSISVDRPDMLVTFATAIDMSTKMDSDNSKIVAGLSKDGPKGALILVLVDAKSKATIWAATVTAKINSVDMETRKRRLEKIVEEIFVKFPG